PWGNEESGRATFPHECPQGRAAPSPPPAGVKETWGGPAFPCESFRSRPLDTPEGASIGHILARCSDTLEKLSASDAMARRRGARSGTVRPWCGPPPAVDQPRELTP